jgi:hypothetical protein
MSTIQNAWLCTAGSCDLRQGFQICSWNALLPVSLCLQYKATARCSAVIRLLAVSCIKKIWRFGGGPLEISCAREARKSWEGGFSKVRLTGVRLMLRISPTACCICKASGAASFARCTVNCACISLTSPTSSSMNPSICSIKESWRSGWQPVRAVCHVNIAHAARQLAPDLKKRAPSASHLYYICHWRA